ncbi:hypothetical protein EMIHUDRAFT_199917 [Emiliania huxleyi CCMP1516]|uniref:Uncharacterized protein n=2 Tax=Emiliania huxleyi TaxID=2903 RepID=A0A0D3KUM2_EMIH1|nr:hypothetical protein EMIHUDRAFT_199917 [Emiliania huxleyi CCMP1516]EOD39457.1 hypothetical protein EMIHUDRAFT_199917 [Emiliania huxleyi CCMP1516]|eukprot:XP_005791886.1 hypothetical protein EMIHUDRAFT_199917 [Emiliania huxleyi CCMP1516]
MADAIFGRLSVYGSVLRTEESSVLLDIATCVKTQWRSIHFPGSDPRGWPLGLAQNSCLIQMVLGIPVPAEPAILTTIRAANELLDLPLHPPLIGACDRILTTLHRLLPEADGIRAALDWTSSCRSYV